MPSHIRYRLRDRVATITIDRPEKRNAMDLTVFADFVDAVKRASSDDEAWVVVVTGVPGSFCAGTDLSSWGGSSRDDQVASIKKPDQDGYWPLFHCPKPVIAAVDGPAVGMGAEFATQCDVRIATERARFAWNAVQRGVVPDSGAGTWLLPRLVGVPAAIRLLLSGDFISADEALELGYVRRVVGSDDLEGAVAAEAERYLQCSPLAMRLIKELVQQGLSRSLDEHMAAHRQAFETCIHSEDHREGVLSFLEKRPPRFVGR